MRELLITNWFVMLVALAFLAFIVFLIVTKQWAKLKGLTYQLMLQAERAYANYEGKKKFDSVFNHLYNNLIPSWLRFFITPEYIRKSLQKWYNLAKQNTLI